AKGSIFSSRGATVCSRRSPASVGETLRVVRVSRRTFSTAGVPIHGGADGLDASFAHAHRVGTGLRFADGGKRAAVHRISSAMHRNGIACRSWCTHGEWGCTGSLVG